MIFDTFLKRNIPQQYQAVDNDEKGAISSLSEESAQKTNSRFSNAVRIFPWIIALFFASLSLIHYLSSHNPNGSFEKGWKTDFAGVRSFVKVEQKRFTGGAAFTEEGKYWMPYPADVKYVGPPSPEIDRNWEAMTWGRYILFSRLEAEEAFAEDYHDNLEALWSPRHGGYYAGFSMFHTLHCLNRLRQALYPDYYPMDDNPDHLTHRDHCFEQIRQYIQCAGDLTPVPTVHNNLRDVNYVDSNLKHSCRAFEPVREWLSERYNGSTAVQPVCENGTYHSHGKLMCNGH